MHCDHFTEEAEAGAAFQLPTDPIRQALSEQTCQSEAPPQQPPRSQDKRLPWDKHSVGLPSRHILQSAQTSHAFYAHFRIFPFSSSFPWPALACKQRSAPASANPRQGKSPSRVSAKPSSFLTCNHMTGARQTMAVRSRPGPHARCCVACVQNGIIAGQNRFRLFGCLSRIS